MTPQDILTPGIVIAILGLALKALQWRSQDYREDISIADRQVESALRLKEQYEADNAKLRERIDEQAKEISRLEELVTRLREKLRDVGINL